MSGTLLYSVNNYWNAYGSMSQGVFFHMWLLFIKSLSDTGRYSIIDVGTGAVSHGSSIPQEWLDWDRVSIPSSTTPISMSDNSWIVFQADNADNNLDGGGSNPWQCKIQYTRTLSLSYDDPSGIDYGWDGHTNTTIMRTSVNGGWVSNPTFDFAPAVGVASNDMRLSTGLDFYFWLDIVADNDTMIWRSSGSVTATPSYYRSRGGYVGMLSPRNTNITYPFLATVGETSSSSPGASGYNAIISKTSGTNYHFENGNWQWPSYSLNNYGYYIDVHEHHTWSKESISYMSSYQWNTQFILPRMIVCSNDSTYEDYCILGEYRLLRATPQRIHTGNLIHNGKSGSNLKKYIQTAYLPSTYGGIAMRWPNDINPIW